VLHVPSRLLLSRLGVSSSPSAALHPSRIGKGATLGDGSTVASARSPLSLRGQVALRFTFFLLRGDALDGMLPLVGLGLGAEPRFGWLGLGAVFRRAAGAGRAGASASAFSFM
jgi:hypothetical protein